MSHVVLPSYKQVNSQHHPTVGWRGGQRHQQTVMWGRQPTMGGGCQPTIGGACY